MDKGKVYVIHNGNIILEYISWNIYIYISPIYYNRIFWDVHALKYYSGIQKQEILPFATAWMKLKGFMLREISQTEGAHYYMVSLAWRIFF